MLLACGGKTEDNRPSVRGAAWAKFAYFEDDGCQYITSEAASLDTFDSLRTVPSADSSSFDWIYKITFGPSGVTVLFGEDRLSINGACCVPEQGVEYADILKWVSNKYSSFDYDLVKP